MWIDTHAHLTGDDDRRDIDALMARARSAGIGRVVNISTSLQELREGIELRRRWPWVDNAAAFHPQQAAEAPSDDEKAQLAELARGGHLIAVGECGLDYHFPEPSREQQLPLFRWSIDLARATRLPLLIHCRDAYSDLFDELAASDKVVLHCFTGHLAEAMEAVARGWMISFSGILTFKKSQALCDVASAVPIEHLFIETDAPYLAPTGFRGQLNEPSFLTATAEKLAQLRGIPLDTLAAQLQANFDRFFG